MPASMFMYGSILIAVTLSPVVLRRRPVDEADDGVSVMDRNKEKGRQTDNALPDATHDSSRDQDVFSHSCE